MHLYPEVRVNYSVKVFILIMDVARYCYVFTAFRMERQLSLLPPLATTLLFASSVRASGIIIRVRIEAKKALLLRIEAKITENNLQKSRKTKKCCK